MGLRPHLFFKQGGSMSWILDDSDEWETVHETNIIGTYPGTTVPFGSTGTSRRKRSPEEVARIRADRVRTEEDAILLKAAAIQARRDQDQQIVTLSLSWAFFDPPDKPHHRMWSLKAGPFCIGEVWHSLNDWCWKICGHEDEHTDGGYASLEAAQTALLAAVQNAANIKA